MKINISKIKDYEKILQSFDGNYIFLDVTEKKLYTNSANSFVVVSLDITDIAENENHVFAFDKNEFIHTLNFANYLILDEKGNFSDDTENFKGIIKNNKEYSDLVSVIKEKLAVSSTSFKETFTYDSALIKQLTRASIFIDPQNNKSDFKYLDVKDGFAFSSTGVKIYLNKVENIKDCLISSEVLKFLNMLTDVKIQNSDNQEFLLSNENIVIYINAPESLNYIPVLGAFRDRYSEVYTTSCIVVNPKELISKLNFISYYAKTVSKTRAVLSSKDNEVMLSVGNYSVKLECDLEFQEIEGEFNFAFNSSALLDTVSKLSRDKDVKIYVSKNNQKKAFILKFDDSEEEVVLTKLQE